MLDDEIFILLEIQSTGGTKHQPTNRNDYKSSKTALSESASAVVNYSMPIQVPVHGNPFGLLHQSTSVWGGKCVGEGRYMKSIHNIWTYINEHGRS